MIHIDIPGFGDLTLRHLVLDYNGTLAVDGKLLPGAREVISTISRDLEIHVVTGDTFGIAGSQLQDLPVHLSTLGPDSQTEAKLRFIEDLGPSQTVAIGNGRNDRKLLRAAAIGIAVIQTEGSAVETLTSADIATNTIWDAFDLLVHPRRLVATLRS